VLDPPHFTPPKARVPTEVFVDGTKLVDVPRGQWGELSWASNSEARLIVPSPSGQRILRMSLDYKGRCTTRWSVPPRRQSAR
jgi:hypothetical protein